MEDEKEREFGIGFIDYYTGFVSTVNDGYKTTDGGRSWEKANLGRACNKIKIYQNGPGETYGYAIGVDVLKLEPQQH